MTASIVSLLVRRFHCRKFSFHWQKLNSLTFCDVHSIRINIYFTRQIIYKWFRVSKTSVRRRQDTDAVTHTRLTAFFSGTTQVSRYQKGKTNLDFTEVRDSEWQWHQLGNMQVCNSLQTDRPNHASTPPLSFLQAGCPSCRLTYSVKALKVVQTRAVIV